MRTYSATSLCTLAFLLAGGRAAGQGTLVPSPPFQGKEIPVPPQQNQAWVPPETKLQTSFLTATTALFDAGLADPRGCDYCVIKVGTGDTWSGNAEVFETHGWVLPAQKGDDVQRFAACWNGLVYPVIAVGKSADLKADVKAVIDADDKERAANKAIFYRKRPKLEEQESVSHTAFLPLKACLLLRLGEVALAEQVWSAWIAGMDPNRNDDAVHLRDPYLMLATDWVWARFNRAICGHCRGDDQLALLDARALGPIHKAVEAEADRQKFERRQTTDKGQKLPAPHLPFLQQLPSLLADQERRALPGKPGPIPVGANQAQRIAALIRQLEDIIDRDIEGYGIGHFDERFKALVKEGEPAVEPLLRCFESDERLLRSIPVYGGSSQYNTGTVYSVAERALSEILKTEFHGIPTTGTDGKTRDNRKRQDLAVTMREYWERVKDVPMHERWYITLADDKLTPAQWLQAAANITRRVTGGEKPVLAGEALRAKKEPSVTDLLVKRIETLWQSGAPGSQRMFRMNDACKMAYSLTDWDALPSLPVLAKLVKMCTDYMISQDPRSEQEESYGSAISKLTQLRVKNGDTNALNDYAAWVKTVNLAAVRGPFRDQLTPMWENPDHPAIAAAAAELFKGEKSHLVDRVRSSFLDNLINTPMMGVTAFRDRLLVELKDTRQAGKLKVDVRGNASLEFGGGGRGPAIKSIGDPQAPKPGSSVTFRFCDYYAWCLSDVEGAPHFELFWTMAQRDRAIAAIEFFLIRFGDRFKFSVPTGTLPAGPQKNQARMTFTPLDRPGTVIEAHTGLAVFAFPGEDKVRVYKLPACPLKAKWTTLKDFPYAVQFYNPTLKQGGTLTEYHQKGMVWQAEEVYRDRKWQRYYGFVGRYIVAKVAAADIEFPAPDNHWAELKGGIDCRLLNPALTIDDHGVMTITSARVGDPLFLGIKLRNRSGFEQAVPGEIARMDAKAGLALHASIRLRVRYTATPQAKPSFYMAPQPDEGLHWQELKPGASAELKSGKAKTVAPGQEFADLPINLNACFDMTRPGSYRVQLLFSREPGGFADGVSQDVEFVLGDKQAGKGL